MRLLLLASSGPVPTSSIGAATLGRIAASGAGADNANATASIALPGVSTSGAGSVGSNAVGSAALARLAASGSSIDNANATAIATLSKVSASGVGGGITSATGSVTLKKVAATASGTTSANSSGSPNLARVSAVGVSSTSSASTASIALGRLAASGSGSGVASASGSATLQRLSASGTSSGSPVPTAGTGSVTLGRVAASGSAASAAPYVPTYGPASLLLPYLFPPPAPPAPPVVPTLFEQDLVAYLNTLGIPVYPGHIPQSATLPALSFLIVSASREARIKGPAGIVELDLQVEVGGRSYLDVAGYSDRLRRSLQGFLQKPMGGTYVFSIALGNQLTRYEPGVDASDRGVHSKISEFTVFHSESIPTP